MVVLLLCGCGSSSTPGPGDYTITGETITCEAGGELLLFEQQGVAVCRWDCTAPDGSQGTVEVDFRWDGTAWQFRSTTTLGTACGN